MSSTDYTSGYTPQDFTGVDTYSANGTFVHTGDVTSGGWHLQRSGTNIFSNGELLTYTYANGAGVWSHPHMGTSYSNGRVQMIYDPTNPNPALRYPEFDFLESDAFAVAGPTVTSITANTIFVPSDTVSNTDFTLLKDASAYANTNISLNGPGSQPPSDARGYTYSLTYNGTASYTATIDSKSFSRFYYDASWTSSPSSGRNPNSSSNRLLAVLGTIHPDTTMESGSNTLTTTRDYNNRIMHYTYSTTLFNVATTIDIRFIVENKVINGVSEIVGYFSETRTATTPNFTSGSVNYIIGDQQTMTYTQSLLGVDTTYSVSDWVYSDEPEGDGYVAPVSTTSNGGGKPDRYPLIMTNLFNRNRSLYSIGMTHKDTWDLFL